MDKETFFIFILNSNLVKFRVVIFSLFSVLEKSEKPLYFDRGWIVVDKVVRFIVDDKEIELPWFIPGETLYNPNDKISIKANQIINIKSDLQTTYGRLLVNQILLVENIGDKIEFKAGNWIKDDIIDDVMLKIAKDDNITGNEAHDFVNALQFLASLTQICVPSASEKSLSTDPNIAKRKKELLEEYKDRLEDPAVISAIEQELISMDRNWLKGDISEGFYKSGKDYNVSRKRMYIMHGGEKSFIDDTKMDLIRFSLEDGWDLDELPKVANSLRDGAYGRGAATAMGGERVKKFQQTFQNSKISVDDCGTKKGADFFINEFNKNDFIGRFTISGKIVDAALINKYMNKRLTIRSPLYCLAPMTDYCEICSGIKMRDNPNVVNTLTASIGSVFMLIEMKATHGKELLTADYDIDNCIN